MASAVHLFDLYRCLFQHLQHDRHQRLLLRGVFLHDFEKLHAHVSASKVYQVDPLSVCCMRVKLVGCKARLY